MFKKYQLIFQSVKVHLTTKLVVIATIRKIHF